MEHNWRTPPEPISPDRITQTLTADVVILGGGQAGTCAARAAAEHGEQVIVLEKNTERRHRYNGGGQVGHINSNFLKSRGVPETDVVEFVSDWQLRSNNRSNPGLIVQYANNCGRCFDWLIEPLSEAEKARIEIRQMPLQGPPKVTVSGITTWVGCVMLQIDNQKKALDYAARTMAGAAQMYLESRTHPAALKDAVCSPGGSTLAGVQALENAGFRSVVMVCVAAAYQRNKELGK